MRRTDRTGIPLLLALAMVLSTAMVAMAEPQVRLKDIARLSGVREYQVLGYGLVVGLDGTGDKTPMSIEMVRGMLQNMGMEIDKASVQSKNVAAVVVTAMLPPFGKAGESFDITVSSIGDAKSLQGGVLLPVLLKGGDGNVYAVAQGQMSVGNIVGGGGAAAGGTAKSGHLTVARVPNGAIQEREVGDSFALDGTFVVMLNSKDPALSRRVKEAVDRKYGDGWAKISAPGSVKVTVPSSFKEDAVSFAASIMSLGVAAEDSNSVVINERTGTIIIGNRVRVSKVTISQGGLKIAVDPPAGAAAKPKTTAGKDDTPQPSMISLQGETTVDDLVKALNAIGATPKDLVSIFQAIQAAGALHGDLKIM